MLRNIISFEQRMEIYKFCKTYFRSTSCMTMKKLFYDVLLKGTKLRNSNYESYRVKYFDYTLDKVNEILKKSSKVHHFTIKNFIYGNLG